MNTTGETVTVSLSEFLLARIAEDEAAVWDLAAVDRPRWLADREVRRRMVEWAPNDLGEGHSAHLFRILALSYADHADYRQEWKP